MTADQILRAVNDAGPVLATGATVAFAVVVVTILAWVLLMMNPRP